MSRAKTLLAMAILALASLAWAPWLPEQAARARAVEAFTSSWEGIVDGCGLNCRGCGVKGSARLLLGYRVEIEYACGLLPADLPEYHVTDVAYVSPLGTVHGLQRP